MRCDHNNRSRYIHGFQCTDKCGKWFSKDSPTYRQEEYMSTLWMALNNIIVDANHAGDRARDAEYMKTKIGIGIKHENYEELIAKAETILTHYGRESSSVNLIL